MQKGLKMRTNYWQEKLAQASHTRAGVNSLILESGPFVVVANNSRLDRLAGEKWLAVGDAAMAFDPLSAQGISKALHSDKARPSLFDVDKWSLEIRKIAGGMRRYRGGGYFRAQDRMRLSQRQFRVKILRSPQRALLSDIPSSGIFRVVGSCR
jgi:hypothetical protein